MSILRRFLGVDYVQPLRSGRRGGFLRTTTAARRCIAPIGACSILPVAQGLSRAPCMSRTERRHAGRDRVRGMRRAVSRRRARHPRVDRRMLVIASVIFDRSPTAVLAYVTLHKLEPCNPAGHRPTGGAGLTVLLATGRAGRPASGFRLPASSFRLPAGLGVRTPARRPDGCAIHLPCERQRRGSRGQRAAAWGVGGSRTR